MARPLAVALQGIMLQTTPTDPAALARRPDPAGPLAVATPTTRKLARRLYQRQHPPGLPRRAAALGRLAGDRPG